jgi:hypothetical protein
MKKTEQYTLLAAVALLGIMVAVSVYAQATPSTVSPSAPAAAPPVTAQSADKTQDAGQFSAHKQKLLDNIGAHIAKMQQKETCLKAAADEKALEACSPREKESSHPADEMKTAPAPSVNAPPASTPPVNKNP